MRSVKQIAAAFILTLIAACSAPPSNDTGPSPEAPWALSPDRVTDFKAGLVSLPGGGTRKMSVPGPADRLINGPVEQTSQAVLGPNEIRTFYTDNYYSFTTIFSGQPDNRRLHWISTVYNVGTGSKVMYVTIQEIRSGTLRHHYDCYSPYYPAVAMSDTDPKWVMDTYYTASNQTLQCTCYNDNPNGVACPNGNGSWHTAYGHVESFAGQGEKIGGTCPAGGCHWATWQYSGNCLFYEPNDGRVCRLGQPYVTPNGYFYLDGALSFNCPSNGVSCTSPGVVYQRRQ